MNENAIQNKRMNQVIFGFVLISTLLLVTISRTRVFKDSISNQRDNETEYVQLPVFGLVRI